MTDNDASDIHNFDQVFAGADDYLDQFVAIYRQTAPELDEMRNLSMLTVTAANLGTELAPIFAAAVRRLARVNP